MRKLFIYSVPRVRVRINTPHVCWTHAVTDKENCVQQKLKMSLKQYKKTVKKDPTVQHYIWFTGWQDPTESAKNVHQQILHINTNHNVPWSRITSPPFVVLENCCKRNHKKCTHQTNPSRCLSLLRDKPSTHNIPSVYSLGRNIWESKWMHIIGAIPQLTHSFKAITHSYTPLRPTRLCKGDWPSSPLDFLPYCIGNMHELVCKHFLLFKQTGREEQMMIIRYRHITPQSTWSSSCRLWWNEWANGMRIIFLPVSHHYSWLQFREQVVVLKS